MEGKRRGLDYIAVYIHFYEYIMHDVIMRNANLSHFWGVGEAEI